MANDLKINSSYDIRTDYVIRTEEEWGEVFKEIKPNLGEIIVIGEKTGNTYTARKYVVGDGNTAFESLERLDINTLHQGGGKTDTVKLANDVYFSTSVGNIPKGTTIQAGETLNYLLQKIANNNTLIDPSVTLIITPVSAAEVGSEIEIKLNLTTSKGSYSNDGEFSSSEFFKDNTKITSPYTIQLVTDGTITFKGQADFKNVTYSNTKTFTGYRKAFAGSTNEELTSSVIRLASATKNSIDSMDSESEPLAFTAFRGDTKVFFAYPSTWNVGAKKPYFEVESLGGWVKSNDFIQQSTNIKVADARENEGYIDYILYCWIPPVPLQATSTNFRAWFK